MDPALGGTNQLILVGVTVAFVTVVMILLWQVIAGSSRRKLERRMDRAIGAPQATAGSIKTPSVRKAAQDSSIKGVDYLAKRFLPQPAKLRARLDKTGRRIAMGNYALASVVLMLALYYAIHNFLGMGHRASALFGFGLGLAIPHLVIGMMIAKRGKRFVRDLPDAIDIIIRGVRSGLPTTESMQIIVREMEGPVATEFGRILDLVKLGLPLDEILQESGARIDVQEMKFFVVSLNIQRETGGNLAETLENLVDILRRRAQMRLKIRALSSEARASAIIIGALPFLMFAVIYSINPEYVGELMTDPRGIAMLVGGCASLGLGIFTMVRMIRMDI